MAPGVFEWTRTFISAVIADQAEYTRVREEQRPGQAAHKRLADQIALIERERPGVTETLLASLVRQREELEIRLQLLDDREVYLSRRIKAGYDTLNRILPFVLPFVSWGELRMVIVPVANDCADIDA